MRCSFGRRGLGRASAERVDGQVFSLQASAFKGG